jgi:hypothetical protein
VKNTSILYYATKFVTYLVSGMFAHPGYDGNSIFTQHMMVLGDFLNGCKEEYFDCKFPAFNSGKMIERQVERGLHEQYFLKKYGGRIMDRGAKVKWGKKVGPENVLCM